LQFGPSSPAQLEALRLSGQLPADTLLWKPGRDAWQPLTDIPELIASMSAHTPPAPPSAPPQQPEPPPLHQPEKAVAVSKGAPRTFAVGGRVLAVAPDDEGDEDEARRWVPGRVLGSRNVGEILQFKVSLDGYDSENDEWVDADDERLQPYEASADAKVAAKQEAQEKVTARLQSEARRHAGALEHEAAMVAD